ncbi:hypothetical protein TRFO_42464 [Tritrichomonas foetus]|uniref:Uncharacterized protein n=1 Tax=Tritrichomonas foetus TaxID=1144522 RepID=A0A1J4L0V9_9EUKA|nr:hypothetical protein TRFO_42464 [Tritrichomonas foetus]|eukprot:OHT15596.1 hypothetical protein TRFO_42464 [Tritrichomonas foetus]
MKQHTDLLEELQNARLQLEDAQKEQARLRRELKKVQARYGGGQQNADNDDGYYSNGGGYSSDEYDEDDDQQQPRRRR